MTKAVHASNIPSDFPRSPLQPGLSGDLAQDRDAFAAFWSQCDELRLRFPPKPSRTAAEASACIAFTVTAITCSALNWGQASFSKALPPFPAHCDCCVSARCISPSVSGRLRVMRSTIAARSVSIPAGSSKDPSTSWLGPWSLMVSMDYGDSALNGKACPSMLASFRASMVNQKPTDLGIPNRFSLNSSRSSLRDQPLHQRRLT
jgi:hypothetical protein